MRLFIFLSFFFLLQKSSAQKQPLTYYLPDIKYDPAIPTPEQLFGFQIGEWHLSHDQLLSYYRLLDLASERVTLHEYARSHEQRPLIYLTITSGENHLNLQSIQREHALLCDPAQSGKLDISKMPVVIYQGFSIHGNEPSGANAAPLVAYYLAAGQSDEVKNLVSNSVVIFDPAFNPDGLQRFSSWVNMHKNQHLTDDSADREYNEAWPGGRTNHYWFDLNRDWLPGQQPESIGRIETFQAWKPNILTDHHEMGSHSTFFFMPGIQSRVNPLTPKMNQELTFKIGEYHAAALDEIGSLYYTEESYDDFYYGKGSTFPDAQGCIGILFEQASSRGHLRKTENGPLSFPFTIRNQVATALSTQKAAIAMRTELLEYQRDFYKNALEAARRDGRKAFIVGEKYDRARLLRFVEMVKRQDIQVFELAAKTHIGLTGFEPGRAFVIPLEQPQRNLILGMFQRDTAFTDSIFYDISAWTMPLAFNLEYELVSGKDFSKNLLGKAVGKVELPTGNVLADTTDYAFAFEWDEYYAPAALFHILKSGIRAKVASKPFIGKIDGGQRSFNYGSIVIPTQNQNKPSAQLLGILKEAAALGHLDIYGLTSGLTAQGIDIGSNAMEPLSLPRVLLVVGEGINPYDAGEVWHLLDTRYGMPVVKVQADQLDGDLLNRFNVVVLPGGAYNQLGHDPLRNWLNAGGTLIALESAVKWLDGKSLANVAYKKQNDIEGAAKQRPYDMAPLDNGAKELTGAIFEGKLDLTHPLAYGYRREVLPVFRSSNEFLEPAISSYAMPLYYAGEPLLSGYMHKDFDKIAPGSAAIIVSGQGRGKVICLADNTNFRAFWYGTNKLLANAIFFGKTISSEAVEGSRKK
ncbi:MAG: zinc carboxypeptidase [Lewinellaceae bacterium]|nr:zinc carboxypeptidase [Saprospiraceae bacterium]MCB9337981.1 zinc carboxypeptidase [Lewinellaceae bacterium]